MKKKLLSIFLGAALTASLFMGCTSSNVTESTASGNGENSIVQNNTGIAKEDLKVGFVHVSDPSDMGYTYNHELGTEKMKEALQLSDDQIISKYNVSEDASVDTALRELIDEGCQIIFATSFGFEDYVIEVAKEYPEIQFCHATGFQAASSGLSNVNNYFASIYEARYLAGIAAGLKTETNKLGYVAAFPYAEVISGYTAFYLGAKSVNPDVTMEIQYTNSWNDPKLESEVAKALIDNGADVISQHSDSTAPATTAEANGAWQVGYNADMIPAAPKASLVSARIDWGVYVTEAVTNVLEGKEIPTDWCKGYADGVVYLTELNADIVAEGTKEAIDEAVEKLIAGELKVFAGPLKGTGNDYSGPVSIDIAEGDYFKEQDGVAAPSWIYIVEGCTVIQ
jgi:Uncharacterized ABC-type transport system, periplasmic component/surface lipoprotein